MAKERQPAAAQAMMQEGDYTLNEIVSYVGLKSVSQAPRDGRDRLATGSQCELRTEPAERTLLGLGNNTNDERIIYRAPLPVPLKLRVIRLQPPQSPLNHLSLISV